MFRYYVGVRVSTFSNGVVISIFILYVDCYIFKLDRSMGTVHLTAAIESRDGICATYGVCHHYLRFQNLPIPADSSCVIVSIFYVLH